MKGTENPKPKVSKEFLDHLKNTPQIPAQKPKQVPVPLSNSQLPSPIVASNKNKKDEDIKEYPIEKICLDARKPKVATKNPPPAQQKSLKQRKQNINYEYQNAYPQLLKPQRKQESSLVKKARDQRISRSLIDMSIYHLLDQTSEKKVKHKGTEKQEYLLKSSKPKNEGKPKIDRSLEKLDNKKNGIKIVNNLREPKPSKQTKPVKQIKPSKQNVYKNDRVGQRGAYDKLDQYYPYEQRDYNYYLDSYRNLPKQNYAPNSHRDYYGAGYGGGYGGGGWYDRRHEDRLGGLYGYGGHSTHFDRYSSGGGYGGLNYGNYMRYY